MPHEQSLTIKDIYQIMVGYQRSQILHTACSLNIFEVLHKSHDGMTSDSVANRIQAESEAVERLLCACVGMGLVEVNIDANGVATYSNSVATEKFLTSSSAMSIRTLCLMQGDFYKIWGRLSTAVKDGCCQMPLAIGTGKAMFQKGSGFHASEDKTYAFMQCMHMFCRMDAPHVAEAFDLSGFETTCDLGGGTGALALEIATKYREMHVTVMELNHVVNVANRFMPKSRPKNLSFVSGDFFQDPLPSVDLFILSHVIHDWDETKIHLLLSKAYKALRPGGALLLCEKTLHPLKDGPMNTLLFDLGMLLASEGKERTADEYRTLLAQNGFVDIQIKELPEMCFRDAILARK